MLFRSNTFKIHIIVRYICSLFFDCFDNISKKSQFEMYLKDQLDVTWQSLAVVVLISAAD